MKYFLVLIIFFSPSVVLGQNIREISLSITDTVIVVKKSKKKNLYAAKVNVELITPNFIDTLFLQSFNFFVSSCGFTNDTNSFNKLTGLKYIIEDIDLQIMKADFDFSPSYTCYEDEIRKSESRYFVNSKQKIVNKHLNCTERSSYDFAKFEINKKNQSLLLYPLFGIYHYYLPKGEYYLYFVYSFIFAPKIDLANKVKDDKSFNGFVSNKVKLIVK